MRLSIAVLRCMPVVSTSSSTGQQSSTAVNDQIVHYYDRNLKICRITNIAEIIISRYGAKSNSILVDVMEYDKRSTRTSIVKMWKIE